MGKCGDDAVADSIGDLLPVLLHALDRVEWVQRHFYPPLALRLAEELTPSADALTVPLRAFQGRACPEDFRAARERLIEVARQTQDLAAAFGEAARSPDDFVGLYRALRRFARIQEALYLLAPTVAAVSRWFLEPTRRADEALVTALREAGRRGGEEGRGLVHAANERDARGGYSLYVPEAWDGRTAMPLAVALHGGSGHGRDFLWSWLREARSRGVLLLAPTSRGRTWSIMGGRDVDAEPLRQMVEWVAARYPVDRTRVLLTGMSDGATYALLCGLGEGMPYTHLAAACGVLHPFLLANGGIARALGRPIYLVHGALDWMFPVHAAQMSRDALVAVGAQVVYREIEDLSHTYPRDENARIFDWLSAVVS